MDEKLIKRLLLARVFELRRNDFTYESLDKPQSVQDDVIETEEGSRNRRRIVLTAHGCSVATCTMCPLPDEAVDKGVLVTFDNWAAQISDVLKPRDKVDVLTLFHNGNWFADREVPPSWRQRVYAYLQGAQVKELVVESLPQYITKERIDHARLYLGDIKLTVAIGLQSSNELVRELCIASTCLGDTFERAVELLGPDRVQAFLMFGSPFLSPSEAAYDLQESIRYVRGLGVIPTICPMKVAPHTVVADLASKGLYHAPSPWDLYRAIFGAGRARIASSLLSEMDMPPVLVDAFAALNKSGKLPVLHGPEGILPSPPDRATILGRIETYLKLCSNAT